MMFFANEDSDSVIPSFAATWVSEDTANQPTTRWFTYGSIIQAATEEFDYLSNSETWPYYDTNHTEGMGYNRERYCAVGYDSTGTQKLEPVFDFTTYNVSSTGITTIQIKDIYPILAKNCSICSDTRKLKDLASPLNIENCNDKVLYGRILVRSRTNNISTNTQGPWSAWSYYDLSELSSDTYLSLVFQQNYICQIFVLYEIKEESKKFLVPNKILHVRAIYCFRTTSL